MTMRTVAAAAIVAVACLAGCKKAEKPKETAAAPAAPAPAAPAQGGIAMTVPRPQVAVGEAIPVTFSAPLNAPAGQQYWITLAKVGEADSEWGSWHYVPAGATAESVSSIEPGEFEIRLHNYYPHHPYGVIARQRVSFLAR